MAERTFGWVQEAYVINNLKKVVQLFLLDSPVNKLLREDKIPRLVSDKDGREEFVNELSQEYMKIPYTHLKGKGVPKGYTRSNSPCTGIVQAVLPGQRKEYQSDWPADSFLRWGISIGFIDYNADVDSCSLSELGIRYAKSADGTEEEYNILTEAFLSYPPICRVLLLLEQNGHLTKFEIGEKLGFIGEAGFTSIPQNLILQGLSQCKDAKERNKILSDTEGTSDKYARTICSWLKQMGWIVQETKTVSAKFNNMDYIDNIPQAYSLTLNGRKVIKHIKGISKFQKIPKRVMWDMLATKVVDREYIRNRRSFLIQALSTNYKTIEDLVDYLQGKGLKESFETIEDDIKSFEQIGLSVVKVKNTFKITDEIVGLKIPNKKLSKSSHAILKDEIRKQLKTVDHKYLILIDLGFDSDSNRDYEIQTAELLTNELLFKGARLGDSRKPDVCVYYKENGLIIDNKAYSKGYSLPISQADEMVRYIEENKEREAKINPNQWWEIFDESVSEFNFGFVSGEFVGGFRDRLQNINKRTGLFGAAINSVNLLLLAEELKSGRMDYGQCFELFKQNDEIELPGGCDVEDFALQRVAEETNNYG